MPLFDVSRGSDWKENGAGHRFPFLLYGGISRRQPRYPAATSWAGSFASLPCDSFADCSVSSLCAATGQDSDCNHDRGQYNTTDGTVRPKSGLSCCSQYVARVDRGRYVVTKYAASRRCQHVDRMWIDATEDARRLRAVSTTQKRTPNARALLLGSDSPNGGVLND